MDKNSFCEQQSPTTVNYAHNSPNTAEETSMVSQVNTINMNTEFVTLDVASTHEMAAVHQHQGNMTFDLSNQYNMAPIQNIPTMQHQLQENTMNNSACTTCGCTTFDVTNQ